MDRERTKPLEPLSQSGRVVALALNTLVGIALYFWATGNLIPTGSSESVWLLAAIAHWLLTLVAAPFFVPPRDALSIGISTALLLAPLNLANASVLLPYLWVANNVAIAIAVIVSMSAVIAIFKQSDRTNPVTQISYRLSTTFGQGEFLLTLAVIISVLASYSASPVWVSILLGFWTVMVSLRPIELLIRLYIYFKHFEDRKAKPERTGILLRVDDPGIVRVHLERNASDWVTTHVHVAFLPDGRSAYVLPLFSQVQNEIIVGTGLCCVLADHSIDRFAEDGIYSVEEEGLAEKLGVALSGEEATSQIAGIVVEGSSIASIRFQVVHGFTLEEGMVVFARIRGKKIYYQILDASTKEESFQQNPYGAHIATANQLGCYDSVKGFEKFPWLPDMNQPLFLASQDGEEQQVGPNEFLIGKIPFTSFGVPVVLDPLIEYHTAVLGITGTGKTELALDIVTNALQRGTKVFCVDFTGEYVKRLAAHNPSGIGLTIAQGSDLEKLLFDVETGEFGAKKEKAALQKFLDAVKPQVKTDIEAFLTHATNNLGVFELAEITNSKATLRTTELYLSAIMDWARKHRKAKQVLIVLEEAHTIVPESFGAGFDADTQWVVGRIG